MTVLNGGESTKKSWVFLILTISLFTITKTATATAAETGTETGSIDSIKATRNAGLQDHGIRDWMNMFLSEIYSSFGIYPSTDHPDSLYLRRTTMNFDNDFIRGNISILNATILGLSKLADDIHLNVNIFSWKATIKVSVARLRLSGRYKADGLISLDMIRDAAKNKSDKSALKSLKSSSVVQSSGSNSNSSSSFNSDSTSTSSGFHGNGNMVALVTGFSAQASAQFFMNMTSVQVELANLDADIRFKSVQVNGTNMRIDETPVDWLKVSRAIKHNFDRIWQNKKDGILSYALQQINQDMMKPDFDFLFHHYTKPY